MLVSQTNCVRDGVHAWTLTCFFLMTYDARQEIVTLVRFKFDLGQLRALTSYMTGINHKLLQAQL